MRNSVRVARAVVGVYVSREQWSFLQLHLLVVGASQVPRSTATAMKFPKRRVRSLGTDRKRQNCSSMNFGASEADFIASKQSASAHTSPSTLSALRLRQDGKGKSAPGAPPWRCPARPKPRAFAPCLARASNLRPKTRIFVRAQYPTVCARPCWSHPRSRLTILRPRAPPSYLAGKGPGRSAVRPGYRTHQEGGARHPQGRVHDPVSYGEVPQLRVEGIAGVRRGREA